MGANSAKVEKRRDPKRGAIARCHAFFLLTLFLASPLLSNPNLNNSKNLTHTAAAAATCPSWASSACSSVSRGSPSTLEGPSRRGEPSRRSSRKSTQRPLPRLRATAAKKTPRLLLHLARWEEALSPASWVPTSLRQRSVSQFFSVDFLLTRSGEGKGRRTEGETEKTHPLATLKKKKKNRPPSPRPQSLSCSEPRRTPRGRGRGPPSTSTARASQPPSSREATTTTTAAAGTAAAPAAGPPRLR